MYHLLTGKKLSLNIKYLIFINEHFVVDLYFLYKNK